MTEFSDVNPVVPIMLKASFKITVSQENDHNYNRPKHNKAMPSYGFGYRRVIYHYTAEPYQSQFFYSHFNGYRLQLSADVICHCSNCRKPQQKAADIDDDMPYNPETEMSLAINLYIFKGDHDSQLEWPFKEEVTVTMYQENDGYNRKIGGFPAKRSYSGGNPNYYNKILHAVAIFEGNQNCKNTGSKLNIKSVVEQEEIDLIHTPQQASWPKKSPKKSSFKKLSQNSLQSVLTSQLLLGQPDDAPAYETPQRSCAPIEKGLLLPLSGWNGNGM